MISEPEIKISSLTPQEIVGQMRLLVLQPTPFCNINCDYCYLPSRSDPHRMPMEIVEAAVRFAFEAELPGPDATICWHAGEPLVLPLTWYRKAFARAAAAAPDGRALPHALQTNAMLIDDAWCDFFLAHGVRIGVSIDGPAALHDNHRRTRRGAGTHAQAMRGVDILKRRGVPFYVITVVTNATLDHPEEMAAFYRAHDLLDVALNIDEMEGANLKSSLDMANVEGRFREFFITFLGAALDHDPTITVREWRDTIGMLGSPAYGRMMTNSQNQPFSMLTVSSRGDMFTFSPELAGLRSELYGSMSIGRLPDASLTDVLSNSTLTRMWRDIKSGISHCREYCRYFDLCVGGAPANKLAECGTFDATETLYCRLVHQAVADIVLADLERRLQQKSQI